MKLLNLIDATTRPTASEENINHLSGVSRLVWQIISLVIMGTLLGVLNAVWVAFPQYCASAPAVTFDLAHLQPTAAIKPVSGWWVDVASDENGVTTTVRGQGQESVAALTLPQVGAYHLRLTLTHLLSDDEANAAVQVYLNETLLDTLEIAAREEAQSLDLTIPTEAAHEGINILRFVYPEPMTGSDQPNNFVFHSMTLQRTPDIWDFFLALGGAGLHVIWQVGLLLVVGLVWQRAHPMARTLKQVLDPIPLTTLDRAVAKFRQLIPPLEHLPLTLAVTGVFLLVIGSYLPVLLNQAEVADVKSGRLVSTRGDDQSYTIPAINFMHGFGFTDSIMLPLERYHLDLTTKAGQYYQKIYEKGPAATPSYTFYRAPGFPLLLSAVYTAFGPETIVARRTLAVLTWLTGLLLLLTGIYLGGWLGGLAGGLTALYHLNYYPGIENLERILTEVPAAFWLALFCFLFVVYLKKRQAVWLFLAAVSFTGLAYTRSNFLVVLPFLLLVCYWQKCSLKELFILTGVVLLPIVGWSAYASSVSGRFITFTTQAEIAFPQFNNIDVLEGIGPKHLLQGGWNPGFNLDDEGNLILPTPYRNGPKPGENGWVKGLIFWRDHFLQLPELFYLKLWRNFWYEAGGTQNEYLRPEGIFLIGIGFLLLALGFRSPPKEPKLIAKVTSPQILLLQLGLIACLFIIWNNLAFWLVLITWFLILTLALLRPYGDYYQLQFPSPTWFLAFVAGYALITLLFGDTRFHQPLDPPLMLFSILGTLMIIYDLIKRSLRLALLFSLIIVGTTLFRFDYI